MTTLPCRKVFTNTLMELAKEDKNIVAVTTDARGSVTLDEFARQLPEQFVEVGIAEQNAVGISAGLATCGKKVFVCGPACFLSARSLEQVKVDVAYAHTNVKVVGVSGGVSYGALGTSHHSLHDIAVMRSISGMNIILPCDARQTKLITEFLADCKEPVYVRMGRNAVADVYTDENVSFTFGKANTLLEGNDITLIGTGETVRNVLDAGLALKEKGIGARVLDLHTIKPLDREAILKAAVETGHVITVEEHSIHSGMGAAVAEVIAQYTNARLKILGIPDESAVPGKTQEVFKYYGLDSESIIKVAEAMLNGK